MKLDQNIHCYGEPCGWCVTPANTYTFRGICTVKGRFGPLQQRSFLCICIQIECKPNLLNKHQCRLKIKNLLLIMYCQLSFFHFHYFSHDHANSYAGSYVVLYSSLRLTSNGSKQHSPLQIPWFNSVHLLYIRLSREHQRERSCGTTVGQLRSTNINIIYSFLHFPRLKSLTYTEGGCTSSYAFLLTSRYLAHQLKPF